MNNFYNNLLYIFVCAWPDCGLGSLLITGLIKSKMVALNCSGTSNITMWPTPWNITNLASGITYKS